MAMIHVNRAGTNLGIFAEEDVREGLRAGRFAGSDLGWREGMAQWQALSRFSEFASEIPTGTSPPPVPSVATSTIAPSPLSPASRNGLPWDERHQRGLFSAFFETLMMVLTQPGAAFTAMKGEGGFGEPLIYALIGGCAGGIVSFLFSLGLQSVGFFADRQNAFGVLAGMGIGSVVFIIILPVLIVIGLFIGALIVHLCLMIVGGANHTFETTFRVLAFTQGSTAPLEIVP
ncbi:MAG: YIP1 family protein, partial [Verrucomicrobiota bacterium]|nr:YIP1 family protein [Verrucomicrobiota bacterium]